MLNNSGVFLALNKVDKNIMKLDAGILETILNLNQPVNNFDYNNLIENRRQFEGNLIIQTMFTRIEVNGKLIDNTTHINLIAWQNAINFIAPEEIMIYIINRETPDKGLTKVQIKELENIAKQVSTKSRKVTVYD